MTVKTVKDLLGLLAFVGLCLAVSALGGVITASSVGTWYQELRKPPFNPPDWIFAPVWTALFIAMGVAAWRVWRGPRSRARALALSAFCLQLGLNLVWSALFFGLRRIDWALAEIVVLLLAIVATAILFWRVDRLAGLLFVPYAAWVAYATLLNAALYLLNPAEI